MLRIHVRRGQIGWNVLGKLVLEFIVAPSQSLALKLGTELLEVIVALAGDLLRS
jgi:hypothetical protein